MEAALDAGADDFQRDADSYVVTTPATRFHAVQDALAKQRLPIQSAELALIPKSTVKVEGADAKKLLNLMEALEELDDVAKISSNFDIDAEAMAEVG